MFESGLNCQACHIHHQMSDKFQQKGETFTADAKSCEPCHGSGYQRILQDWNRQVKRKLSQLSEVLLSARKTIATKTKSTQYALAEQKLSDAYYNFNLVKHGNAIHNIAFANKLLDKSYDLARESLTAVGVSPRLPFFEKEKSLIPGECSNCHSGIPRVEKKVFGWIFPHNQHLITQGLSCNRCHSNVQKHGKLVIKKGDCMNCHHGTKEVIEEGRCQQCHDIQHALYFSRLEFSTFNLPNLMAEEVACLDCHLAEDDSLYRPDRTVCSQCHEEEYEEMFAEWETGSLSGMKELRDKVSRDRLRKGDKVFDTLQLLEKDGSKGIHNPELFEKLIKQALEK
jgi:hypothetical protein